MASQAEIASPPRVYIQGGRAEEHSITIDEPPPYTRHLIGPASSEPCFDNLPDDAFQPPDLRRSDSARKLEEGAAEGSVSHKRSILEQDGAVSTQRSSAETRGRAEEFSQEEKRVNLAQEKKRQAIWSCIVFILLLVLTVILTFRHRFISDPDEEE